MVLAFRYGDGIVFTEFEQGLGWRFDRHSINPSCIPTCAAECQRISERTAVAFDLDDQRAARCTRCRSLKSETNRGEEGNGNRQHPVNGVRSRREPREPR